MSRAHALDVCRILRSKFKSYVKSNLFVVALNALFFVFSIESWQAAYRIPKPARAIGPHTAPRLEISENSARLTFVLQNPVSARLGSTPFMSSSRRGSALFLKFNFLEWSSLSFQPGCSFFFCFVPYSEFAADCGNSCALNYLRRGLSLFCVEISEVDT